MLSLLIEHSQFQGYFLAGKIIFFMCQKMNVTLVWIFDDSYMISPILRPHIIITTTTTIFLGRCVP